MKGSSTPASVPQMVVGSTDNLSPRTGSHQLQDRVAVFLATVEGAPSAHNPARSQLQSVQGSVSNALDSARLPPRTVDQVQARRQVVVLLDNESEDVVGRAPSTDTVAAQPQRSRGKRIRSEGNHYGEAPADIRAQHEGALVRPEKERRAEPRSHPATPYQVAALPVFQYYTPAVLHSVGESQGGRAVIAQTVAGMNPGHPVAGMNPSHTVVDVSTFGQVASDEVEALTTGSAVQGVPAVPAVDHSGSSTEQTSEPTRMTALEKAKLDWDTHITAMEHILSINQAQGLPAQSVSLEALQLLSQMVSNLYALNTKLLDTQMHQLLDNHQRNVERINKVFQGLAGLKRAPEKQGE